MPRKKKTIEDRIFEFRSRIDGRDDEELERLLDDIEAELYTLRRQIRLADEREKRRGTAVSTNS